MVIHGVCLDFALYDADKDTKHKYFQELEKMQHISENVPHGNEQEKNKYLCDSIKQMFDGIFGEGAGVEVCGEENDLLLHMDAYEQLVNEQIRQQEQYKDIMDRLKLMRKRK